MNSRQPMTALPLSKEYPLINATAFIAYTNNFKDFGGNAKKIATVLGGAAFAQESGTSVHKVARVSKNSKQNAQILTHTGCKNYC